MARAVKTLYECYKCRNLSEERPTYVYVVTRDDALIYAQPLCKRCLAVATTPIAPGFRPVILDDSAI